MRIDILIANILVIIGTSTLIILALIEIDSRFTHVVCKKKWLRKAPYTHLVREAIYFTGSILHEHKIKQYPSFRIYYFQHKKFMGVFNGVVIIYLKSNPDVPTLVNTVLHEVKHYMQSKTDKQFKRYDEFTNIYGYYDNPFEIESRAFADEHCDACLQYLESKQLIRRA